MNITFGYAPDTLTRTTEWMDQAACKGQTKVMFPEPTDKAAWGEAIRLCNSCPVAAACLTAALHEEGTRGHKDRHGVRGARTPYQRWVLAKKRGIRPAQRRYIVRNAA